MNTRTYSIFRCPLLLSALLALGAFLPSARADSTPELLHYKFSGTGTSVPNLASNPPAGTATATITGAITQTGTDLNAAGDGHSLLGSGNSSTTDYLNTGWATNLSSSWTISFVSSNLPSSSTTFYAFGDVNAGAFRCFTNGVAGPNNWILRGPFTDVLATGGATAAPHRTTFVYDQAAANIKAYVDGVLVNTVAQGSVAISGAGPFKVAGYSSNTSMPAGSLVDDFRVYNRALSDVEVQNLDVVASYVVTTTPGSIVVTDPAAQSTVLDVFRPADGLIKFSAPGRTFRVNNGPVLSGDSGDLTCDSFTAVTVNAGGGGNTINFAALNILGALTVTGGAGDDTVNFNGLIILVGGPPLTVDLQSGANPGDDTIHVAGGVSLSTNSGITLRCSRNVALDPGSYVSTGIGNVTVEANQQAIPTSGNFTGIAMEGATLEVGFDGNLTVKGRGGDDPGGYQLGVSVSGGSRINGGTSGGVVEVVGTGGDSTNIVNRGVTVIGDGSAITSAGALVNVTGVAGAQGGYFGIGVSLLAGGKITTTAYVSVTSIGAGAPGSGFNQGLEMGGGTEISSANQNVFITAYAGPGGSSGVFLADGSAIVSQGTGPGGVTVFSDSISIDGTSSISSTGPISSVILGPESTITRVDLGSDDDNTSTPKVFGLTDAELDRITTPRLVISPASFSQVQITAPISPANAANLTIEAVPATGSILATNGGTDVTLPAGGVLTVDGPLLCPITGLVPDTDFPQLKVVGGVNLNNRALKLDGTTYPGSVGDTFVIVDNDSNDPVAGTFAGLPEGTLIDWPAAPGTKVRISYVGGSGNDITLTLPNDLLVSNNADSGFGSLRNALAAAAAKPGPDTVTVAPSLSGQLISLSSEIAINDPAGITLDGSALPGGLHISDTGNVNRRLFSVAAGTTFTLRKVNFIDGGGTNFFGDGGAILNTGTVSLTDCSLLGNIAQSSGGALYNNAGTMTLTRCTLFSNQATKGGAIYTNGGTLTLTQCTFNGNSILAGGTFGGAIASTFANTTLVHCTVSGNSALTIGAGIYSNGAGTILNLDNTIVAGNSPDNLNGSITSGSHNLTSGNPLLGPLAANGGPTQTMAVLPGSPALDGAVVIPGLAIDQRGYARNINGDAAASSFPDIGAYEAQTAAGQIVGTLSDNTKVIAVTTAADELDTFPTLGTGISLREALRDVLFSGGGIVFDPAVFNGEPADTITFAAANPGLLIDKNVTIDASNISGGVTVNAAASAMNEKRVFAVNVGRTVALLGLNITGGYKIPGADQIGGGLLNHGNTTLTNCRITGNTAVFGGGIVSYSASAATSLTVRRCTISGNVATSNGGGLINWGFTNAATLQMEDCAVTGNQASSRGGGLYSYATASATTTSTVLRTTLSGNSAASAGGCFNFSDSGSSTLSFSHCTISNNTVTGQGGGCYSDGFGNPVMTFAYTIVAGNNGPPGASNGHDIFKQRGTITSSGGNLIGDTTSSGVSWLGSDLTGTGLSPLAARLAPLGNYGGSTQTMALLPTSPARNAATGSPATADQRAFPIVGGTPDIGAYEAGTFANYDAWAWETLPESATPAQHAATANLDGDGRTNFLEFGTLTSGSTPGGSAGLLVTRNAAGNVATLVMSYRYSTPGLFYNIERSTVPGTWTPIVTVNSANGAIGAVAGIAFAASDPVSLTFTDTFITGQPKVFYRLKVMQQ